jgi:hypothetical protein
MCRDRATRRIRRQTASAFRTTPAHTPSRLQARTASAGPLSIYIHIPFCDTICYYCACNKIVTRDHARADAYLDTLLRELAMKAALGQGQPRSGATASGRRHADLPQRRTDDPADRRSYAGTSALPTPRSARSSSIRAA